MVELLLVRAALGTTEQLGQRVDSHTQTMKMPGALPSPLLIRCKRLCNMALSDCAAGLRVGDPHQAFYNSVRCGPHRPTEPGRGDDSPDASVVHVVYEGRQMYPSYIVQIELGPAPQCSITDHTTEQHTGTSGLFTLRSLCCYALPFLTASFCTLTGCCPQSPCCLTEYSLCTHWFSFSGLLTEISTHRTTRENGPKVAKGVANTHRRLCLLIQLVRQLQ